MEKDHLHIRWLHMMGYLLFLAGDIGAFFVLRSYFLLMIAVVIVFMGILSVYGMISLAGSLQIKLYISDRDIVPGDGLELQVKLFHRGRYFALNSLLSMEAENVFRESQSSWEISMPIQPSGTSRAVIPLKAGHLGKYEIRCKKAAVRDLLGIMEVVLRTECYGDAAVLPDLEKGDAAETSGFLSGMSETEESREKGHDFSEVHDIREYIPGDKLRDIHWKLSAKQGEWMVKERVSVSGSQMVIMITLTGEKELSEMVLECAGNVAASFLAQNLPVCLLVWNGHQYEFEEFVCGDMEELRRAFHQILSQPLSVRVDGQQSVYLKNNYPFLGTYLSVAHKDSQVQVVMKENV